MADNLDNFDEEIDEKEAQTHRLDSLIIFLYVCLLILTVLTVWLLKHRRIRYVHETGLALVYGLVIGAILQYGAHDFGKNTALRVVPSSAEDVANITAAPDILLLEPSKDWGQKAQKQLFENKTLAYTFKGEVRDVNNEIDQKTIFDPELFFNILLPPIIFHAGYSMKKRFFFRNIGSILVFAFIGTTLSTFTVAGIMYVVTLMFPYLKQTVKFIDTLRFGALISATDPVTVLAIFNDLNVDVNLYALIFGEAVLNDAVAIVITRTIEDYEENLHQNGGDQQGYIIFFKSLGEFVGIFGASFLVGSLMGCVTALITKFTHIKQHPQLESTLFILMSYSTFLLAEVLHLTGIVAVLFCGICQAHYTYNNLSKESCSITKQFFALLSFMADNFIFSYVGVSMFTFPKHKFDPAFIIGSFIAIIVGRAVNIYPLSFLLNLGRKTKITPALQHMLFLSGLRGAIAFALSISNTSSESRQMIFSTTLLIVAVTVIICGGSTMSLLTWLGIPLGGDDDDEESNPIDYLSSNPSSPPHANYNTVRDDSSSTATGGDNGMQIQVPIQHGITPGKSWLARLWSGVDVKFMKPLLTHSNPTLMETMPSCCLGLSRILTSSEQLSKHPAMMAGTLTDDLDPVEENVITSPSGGISTGKDNEFNFPRQKSDDSNGNGGLKRRPPQLESPERLGDATGKILPSHI